MKLESTAFKKGEKIPSKYTCQGMDEIPPLKISGVPKAAKSLALIMDDPDAPGGTWVHWLVWNIPPNTELIDEDALVDGVIEGKNSWGRFTYGGPCPPSGSHRYYFKLYALDEVLSLTSADKKALEDAMKGHILDQAELMGTFKKS